MERNSTLVLHTRKSRINLRQKLRVRNFRIVHAGNLLTDWVHWFPYKAQIHLFRCGRTQSILTIPKNMTNQDSPWDMYTGQCDEDTFFISWKFFQVSALHCKLNNCVCRIVSVCICIQWLYCIQKMLICSSLSRI